MVACCIFLFLSLFSPRHVPQQPFICQVVGWICCSSSATRGMLTLGGHREVGGDDLWEVECERCQKVFNLPSHPTCMCALLLGVVPRAATAGPFSHTPTHLFNWHFDLAIEPRARLNSSQICSREKETVKSERENFSTFYGRIFCERGFRHFFVR